MKFFILFILLYSTLFSKVYYSKVSPYEIRDISSNVSGIVIRSDENMLGKRLSAKPYIKVDAQLDKEELAAVKKKLLIYANTMQTNQKILQNFKALLAKKQKKLCRDKKPQDKISHRKR